MNRKEKIFELLLNACEKAFNRLFEEHNEHFYYCSLVMMEVATPCITALSEEAYKRLLNENAGSDALSEEDKAYYRWAYAESPYLGFGYDEYFGEVDDFFCMDVSYELPDEEYEEHVGDWLLAMRKVMKTLKDKGTFNDACNTNVFLLAEQQPPETNINLDNAHYLNEDDIFEIWHKDNIEEYE